MPKPTGDLRSRRLGVTGGLTDLLPMTARGGYRSYLATSPPRGATTLNSPRHLDWTSQVWEGVTGRPTWTGRVGRRTFARRSRKGVCRGRGQLLRPQVTPQSAKTTRSSCGGTTGSSPRKSVGDMRGCVVRALLREKGVLLREGKVWGSSRSATDPHAAEPRAGAGRAPRQRSGS